MSETEIDVTEEFRNTCKLIGPGELSHVSSFDLQDVMTAIELMDPKMDARMQIQRKIVYLKEALDNEWLPLDDIGPRLLHGILDETLSCLVNWLKGDTLGQTVFINMYMHCTDRITNKTLRGFCEAIKNIIVFIRDLICKASVAEEEDFYISTSRMPLDDLMADNRVAKMLKEADDELSKSLKSDCSQDTEIIASLQHRVRFIRAFLLWTIVIKKFLQNSQSKPLKDSTFSEGSKYLVELKYLIEQMKSTIGNGESVGPGKKNPSKESYGLVGFEPYLNQPLLPPAIPRCADIEERQSAMDYLEKLIIKLIHINEILIIDINSEIFQAWDFIQHFGRFGCEGAESSCVLTRSLLLTFYILFFSSNSSSSSSILNSVSSIDSVNHHHHHNQNNNKIDIIKSSIRQFIRLTSWPEIESTIKLDEKLAIFIAACADNLFQIPITHCLNRSRQRNRLELIIDAHWDLYDECMKVDHILRSFINHQSINNHSPSATNHSHSNCHNNSNHHHNHNHNHCHNNNNNNHNKQRFKEIPPIFSSFVALFQFRAMFDYLISGFELNLYAQHELISVYFILSENVLKYFLSHLLEIESIQQREQSKLLKISNKKTRKIIDKEIQSNLVKIAQSIVKLKSYHQLTVGLFYLMAALTKDGKLAKIGDICRSGGNYTSSEMCYEKRFQAIISRGWFYESASYQQFEQHLSAINEKPVSELYEMAAAGFDNCRKSIDKCGPEPFTDSSASQLDNIAKNNMVVARILARGGLSGAVHLNFEESKEKAFPLIKIEKK